MSPRRAGLGAALALAVALGTLAPGCRDSLASSEASAAQLPTTVVTLVTSDGREHRYTVELATTAAEQARGLMYRRSMPPGTGMLFPMSPPRQASFWMENTFIPLDIVFIGADRRVLNVGQGKPQSRDLVESIGPAAAVLELNAGEAARIGLRPGDKVEWQG